MIAYIKKASINISVVLLSVFVTLCLLEVMFRAFSDICDKSWLTSFKLFSEYDPLLGWRLVPDFEAVRALDGYSVIESHNSRGIRGPEYSYKKEPDEYRILILGDSFAHGFTVDFSEMFSEVLKRGLNNESTNINRHFEVINTGTGGWSTDQELLFFQNEGKKYNSDLTVLMFCSNDVWYNSQPAYWCGPKPLFELDDGDLVLTNVPVPREDPVANQNEARRKQSSFYDMTKMWLTKKSCLYHDFVTRIKGSYRLYNLAIKLHLAADLGECFVPIEWRIFQKNCSSEICSAYEITEALIIKLSREADSVGSRFVLFYIPSMDVSQGTWEKFKSQYGVSDRDWSPHRLSVELQRICGKNNIDFINPTESFKKRLSELRTQGEGLNAEDGHWNRYGHELVGEILTEFVSRNYLDAEFVKSWGDS